MLFAINLGSQAFQSLWLRSNAFIFTSIPSSNFSTAGSNFGLRFLSGFLTAVQWTMLMRRLDSHQTRRNTAPVERMEGNVRVHQANVPHIHSLLEYVQVAVVFILRHQ